MKFHLSLHNLEQIMPHAVASGRLLRFHQPLNVILEEFEITTKLRIAAFLSQIAVESGEFKWLREIFGPTTQQLKYEPPHPLALRLGNIHPGDGLKYIGRGLIQVTGRANYRACAAGIDVDCEAFPALLEDPWFACRSAGWFWDSRRINGPADQGNIAAVTRAVNGGETALAERTTYYRRALLVL